MELNTENWARVLLGLADRAQEELEIDPTIEMPAVIWRLIGFAQSAESFIINEEGGRLDKDIVNDL
jgi:hypothetical protein